jgi:hypothetical protein
MPLSQKARVNNTVVATATCVPVINSDRGIPVIYSCKEAAKEPTAPKPVTSRVFKPGIKEATHASNLFQSVLIPVHVLDIMIPFD